MRIATIEDLEIVKTYAYKFWKESPYAEDFTYDARKAENLIKSFLTAKKEEKIVLLSDNGCIAAAVDSPTFSSDKTCIEFVWWVSPEARKGTEGSQLRSALEYWARKVGCKVITMSNLASPRLDKVYERWGYKKVEHAYIKVL